MKQNKIRTKNSMFSVKMKAIVCTLMALLITSLLYTSNTALAEVKRSREAAVVAVGETVLLKVSSKNRAKWESNRPHVAQVNKRTGKVKGVSAGKATIRAYVNNRSYDFQITVDQPSLICEEVLLSLEETFDIEVKGSERDFSYSVLDEDIAEIDPSGTITAIDPGETYVLIFNGKTELICKVIVTDDFFSPEIDSSYDMNEFE